MKISFHGAARTVTGSKHLVQLKNGKKFLLDCGLFQGMGKETVALNSEWGFEPAEVSFVIVSHAHVDHVGLLPKLVKDGFEGNIYCTPQTADLARILLADSGRIQESDVIHVNKIRERQGKPLLEPLYSEEEAMAVLPMLIEVPHNQHYEIDEDVTLLYTNVGHITGSAAINLIIKEKGRKIRLTFSGDVGRYGDLILASPEEFPQADVIILESTYGNRLHELVASPGDKLLSYIVKTCLKNKGKLIIPSFSVGRTQELLYLLNRLETEGRLPPVPYYVDSPLSILATEIVKSHPECFNREVRKLMQKDKDVFSFKRLEFIETAEESKKLNSNPEPCVIISASGMAEAGRVKHHIANNIGRRNSTILIVGYCEPNSLAGKLRDGAGEVTIFGERYQVEASVGFIESMSAHSDYEGLSQWLSCQDPSLVKKMFLVHGDYESQVAFRDRLIKKGFDDIEIPSLHQQIGLGDL